MGQRDYIDPFGAPEFLVDGVAYREKIETEMIRLAFCSSEQGERILRLRLVMPIRCLISESEITRRLLAEMLGCMPLRAH